ncbi:MAG: HopJ type III effector protein [Pseudomonadales bacterium]
MKIDQYLIALREGKVDFEDTMAVISENYEYTPCSFRNGLGDKVLLNALGQNEASLKIFSFAKLQGLSEEETLQCFGRFYRDVLDTPDAKDHKNIRNFIVTGWAGIKFANQALKIK